MRLSVIETSHCRWLTGCVAAFFAILSLAAWHVSSGCDPADSHTIASLAVQFIIWSALSWRGRVILDRLSAASRNLSAVQTQLLLNVLRRNGSTLFGRRHFFDSVRTRADFVANVPLSSYDNYAEYIEKITSNNQKECAAKSQNRDELPVVTINGRDGVPTDNVVSNKPISGILTADKVEFLACSAGTSGRNKIVPITHLSKVRMTGFFASHLVTSVTGVRPYLRCVRHDEITYDEQSRDMIMSSSLSS